MYLLFIQNILFKSEKHISHAIILDVVVFINLGMLQMRFPYGIFIGVFKNACFLRFKLFN